MPPSINYFNQVGPFWDFVADLETQGSNHPLFARDENRDFDDNNNASSFGVGWPFQRGGNHVHHHRHPNPGPPYFTQHSTSPPPPFNQDGETEGCPDPPSPQPPVDQETPKSRSASPSPHRHGRHNGHGPRRGHGCGRGSRGGGRGGFPFGPRGWRGWGRPGGFGDIRAFDLGTLAALFREQVNGGSSARDLDTEAMATNEEFKPSVDVFDTESAFVVHVSLPGAKKEDVGVHWDADKSELSISGIVHRPGDEEFLRSLAMSERQIGVFNRKIRLGSRANPAQVDADAISAKFEDGVLRIEVRKEDKDYVDIKKVDIE